MTGLRRFFTKANLKEGLGEKIKLIIASNESLGFSSGATRAESKQRAQELGIGNNTLPAIVGTELRKQYTNQPNPEYILIDMESISDRYGFPSVFNVYRNSDGLWLGAGDGKPDRRWYAESRWAFSQD